MATHFTGNDGDGITLTVNAEFWINAANSYVTNAGDAFSIAATQSNDLLVLGTIVSEEADAINADIGSYAAAVSVAASGHVVGGSDGIELEDTNHRVVNHGVIEGLSDAGIELRGENLVNNGDITNFGDVYGALEGVTMLGSGAVLNNSGTIHGDNRGAEILSGNNSFIGNSGTMSGDIGVVLNGADATATNKLVNTGTIIGNEASVAGSFAVEFVSNAGTLAGNVVLEGGDDVVRNSGTIEGGVDLGDGADNYRARGDGNASSIFAGLGNDTVLGGSEADIVYGGEGEDTVRGGGGDDQIAGDAGNDALTGSDGDDVIEGGAGADTLRGNDDGDALFGGEAADALFGGADEDTLEGGRQNDTMTGGSGADTFIIIDNNDTDVIRDFERGVDTLDLSALGFATAADALAAATNAGGNVVFAFGGNDQVTVEGITLNQIAGDLFV